MVRWTLNLEERWQAVGMSQAGFRNKRLADQMGMGVHNSVIDHHEYLLSTCCPHAVSK